MGVWDYLERGGRRAYLIWHRRAGKDDICLHWAAKQLVHKPATYWHMLPEASQARKAIWDALNPHTGKRRIDEAFPEEAFKQRDQDMKVTCRSSGGVWQLVGSDNYNSLVGSPPYGVVFSEWALADPQAWSFIQPILEENGGWALFITTPRGRNHAATFYKMAEKSPDWYCEKLTVNDTSVFSRDQMKRILLEAIAQYGADEGKSKVEQEYYCSFDAAIPGSYYGSDMNYAEQKGRITRVPYEPSHPVYPCFDFGRGVSNATAIPFVQLVGFEPRVIDYWESNDCDIEGIGKMLKAKDYFYGRLILPHDGGTTRLSNGMSYARQFMNMGFKVSVVPRTDNVGRDIKIVKQNIKKFYFDNTEAADGSGGSMRLVEALRNYQREFDHSTKQFKNQPKHDWSSHPADGFRTAVIGMQMGLLAMDDLEEDDGDFENDMLQMDRDTITGY